jgi:hypothetical protein
MEEKTADEIAAIFSAAGDSVTVINTAKTSDETDDEYKDKIKRNVDHLEIIKETRQLCWAATRGANNCYHPNTIVFGYRLWNIHGFRTAKQKLNRSLG